LAVTLHFYVMVVEWCHPKEAIGIVPDLLLCGEKELDRYSNNHGDSDDSKETSVISKKWEASAMIPTLQYNLVGDAV